ncbi:MAG: hypothetical protein ACT4O4_07405 [Nitrospiraceae bacterium]
MSLIQRVSRFLAIPIARSSFPAPVNDRKPSCRCLHRVTAIVLPISAGLCFSLASSQASAGMDAENKPAESGTVVAAGFGFQIGEISTITVKVYDAATGEVLSEDLYELNVKEGNGPGSNASQERIFAGGVGLGAADLSNFVLRVYDAKTGTFQWEGQLNLLPHDSSGAGQLVSALVPRRAVITKVHAAEPSTQQPMFLLRALDASTGGLVWEDEFSAFGIGTGWRQPLLPRLISLDGTNAAAFNTFDFRIRMFDRSGRTMLWEDRISPQEAEEDTREAVDDQARILPVWPREPQQGSRSEAI